MTNFDSAASGSRTRTTAYWVTTVLVAAVLAVGGVLDVLQIPYARGVMERLGYPAYFLVILGVWKVPGAVMLLVPRSPRLKEWAYAGAVFTFTGAVASHLAAGDGAETLVAPILFTGLTVASWALRPPARRDLVPG
jgi:uncharacterized membrane protein YphA (DoxX/SURF4 family)